MHQKTSTSLQRALSMLLCIAMLLSFAVMPVGAVETTNPQSVATQQENGVAEGTPYEKFTLALDNVNYY